MQVWQPRRDVGNRASESMGCRVDLQRPESPYYSVYPERHPGPCEASCFASRRETDDGSESIR